MPKSNGFVVERQPFLVERIVAHNVEVVLPYIELGRIELVV